jgi:POT family proton-dependent oligopeptide transporter
MTKYKIAPVSSRSIPSGIPYIVANEAAERFSYYGMRAILVVFMTQYLMNSAGELDVMNENEAQGYFHLFVSAVYFMPILGAMLADGLIGKYRTILFLSLFYCFGHFALALDDTRMGLLIGQGLIALGAGGIKPCVSSHLGDQFGASNFCSHVNHPLVIGNIWCSCSFCYAGCINVNSNHCILEWTLPFCAYSTRRAPFY